MKSKRKLRKIVREGLMIALFENVDQLVKKVASGSRSENDALKMAKEDELYKSFDDKQKEEFELALEEYYEERMMGG